MEDSMVGIESDGEQQKIENVSTETNNDLRSSQNIYGFETEFKQKQIENLPIEVNNEGKQSLDMNVPCFSSGTEHGATELVPSSSHVQNKQQSIQEETIDLCSSDDEELFAVQNAILNKSLSVISNRELQAKTDTNTNQNRPPVIISEIRHAKLIPGNENRTNTITFSVNTKNESNIMNTNRSFQRTRNPVPLPDVCQTTEHVIDLADDSDSNSDDDIRSNGVSFEKPVPAALPILPSEPMPSCSNEPENCLEADLTDLPPTPILLLRSKIPDDPSLCPNAIMKWDFDTQKKVEGIERFEIFCCRINESSSSQNEWRLVGAVKALPMPMACTIQLATDKNVVYYFCIRARDIHNRYGEFSIPHCIEIK